MLKRLRRLLRRQPFVDRRRPAPATTGMTGLDKILDLFKEPENV